MCASDMQNPTKKSKTKGPEVYRHKRDSTFIAQEKLDGLSSNPDTHQQEIGGSGLWCVAIEEKPLKLTKLLSVQPPPGPPY